ncbi:MAG: autorepressor SdpR family transcription factor [Ruminococcus sp.]|nr:autorepressor SdpR family transcription factor [Ruminococcus sp.]MDE6788003.1 autorepressor SdpR family transcription factor [Ruminococcus sp.]
MIFESTFKALSDPIRRKILTILKNGKLSAGEICSYFEITDAAVSYHLNLLKKADLISESRYKNFIYYELNTSVLDDIILWIKELKESDSDEKIRQSENNNVSNGTATSCNSPDSNAVSS